MRFAGFVTKTNPGIAVDRHHDDEKYLFLLIPARFSFFGSFWGRDSHITIRVRENIDVMFSVGVVRSRPSGDHYAVEPFLNKFVNNGFRDVDCLEAVKNWLETNQELLSECLV